jgi:hypothetical protein
MVEGYRFVDGLLADGRDPLAQGESRSLLEINHIVLCGLSPERRTENEEHVAATEARFYDDHEAGADGFYDWLKRSRGGLPEEFAARLYVRMVSSPQMFIEGNQRTATLCASHVLAAHGEPPLVAHPAFMPVAAACRRVDRRRLWGPVYGWFAVRRLTALLRGRPGIDYALDGPAPWRRLRR